MVLEELSAQMMRGAEEGVLMTPHPAVVSVVAEARRRECSYARSSIRALVCQSCA
jgi:hypothetical protein